MGCTISHKDGIIKRIGLNRRLQSDQDNFNENSPRAPQIIHAPVYHQDEKPIVRFGFERDTDSVKNALVDFMALNALPSVDTDNAVLNEHSVAWGQATTGGGSPASFTIAGEGSVEGVPTELQYICGTGVSFEWLFQRLIEKFKCPDEPPPQWIVEKLNVVGGKDLDKTTVMKVTFGWDNEKLPKSVVLKICETHEDDSPAEAKLASKMFRRNNHLKPVTL
ncbi:hypothetical protein Ddc_06213 [Ditylenchus destructor]|nr:hypothetical protein Ddc_06213 [Ditylenchus destructor]